MTLLEAIQSRHSVRKYIDKPIEEDLVSILQKKVNEVNAEGNILLTNRLHQDGLRHCQVLF